jgi:cell division protein FtsL
MYTQKKPIENSHIVRERDRQRFRELLAVFVLGLPVGLFLLVFTWQNLEVIRLGHEATRLQKSRTDLDNIHKSLQFEIDRLTSLEAVEQKATTLGFRPTDPHQLVVVSNDPSAATPVQPSGVVVPDPEVAQPLVTQPVANAAPLPSSPFTLPSSPARR